jgi:hypothetical protein
MLSLANSAKQRDPITLTDKVLERSAVLEMMLDIVYTQEVDCLQYITLHKVLGLAGKWEFEFVPRLIKSELQRHDLDVKRRKFQIFELSLLFKDPSLIARWVNAYHHVTWDAPVGIFYSCDVRQDYEEAAQGLKNVLEIGGAGIFEVGGWGYQRFLRTSPTVIWALLRATRLDTTRAAKIDYDVVAKEFEKLLTLACKLSCLHTTMYDRSADTQTNRNQI